MDWILGYVAVGAIVGFLSGLFGIGGGAVIVPALTFIFAAEGFAPENTLHLALATGVASILFTSISAVRSHHARRAVNWRSFRLIAPAVLAGTFTGALVAGYLNARVLSVLFTALMWYVAAQLWRQQPARAAGAPINAMSASLFGLVLGWFSSLTAIGGASLVVPFLAKHGHTVHEAVGTAAAVAWPVAAAGTLGYAVSGFSATALPDGTIGYIYLPALFGIVAASVFTAPAGANVAHRIAAGKLKKYFAVVLFVLPATVLVKLF